MHSQAALIGLPEQDELCGLLLDAVVRCECGEVAAITLIRRRAGLETRAHVCIPCSAARAIDAVNRGVVDEIELHAGVIL